MIETFKFQFKDARWVNSCTGCGYAQDGEEVNLLIDTGIDASWPSSVKAVIVNIEKTPMGPIYTFSYDGDDWIPACDIRDCYIIGTSCRTCCDDLDLTLDCAEVLTCLDDNGDGIIDDTFLPPTDVTLDPNFCEEVVNCLDSDGDGVIDEGFLPPLDVTTDPNFCSEVVSCLDGNGDGVIDDGFLPDLDCSEVLSCLDTNGDGVIDDGFLPTGLTVGDVTGDPSFCAAVEACIAANPQAVSDAIETLTLDCGGLPAA